MGWEARGFPTKNTRGEGGEGACHIVHETKINVQLHNNSTNMATGIVPQTAAATWRVLRAPACLISPLIVVLIVLLCLYVVSGAVHLLIIIILVIKPFSAVYKNIS